MDTNILVYAAIKNDVRHEACVALLNGSDGGFLYLSPQVLAEFYSAITNPKRVSIPYTPDDAIKFIETLLRYLHVIMLPISRDVPLRWMSLLKSSAVTGQKVYDVQLAATMLSHGLTRLFTYNGADFKRFTQIEVVEPHTQSTVN